MAIELNQLGYDGVKLTYGKITHIEIDVQAWRGTAHVSGFASEASRRSGGKAYLAQSFDFDLPPALPENLVAHAYERYPVKDPA
jgi:hypothetical protein